MSAPLAPGLDKGGGGVLTGLFRPVWLELEWRPSGTRRQAALQIVQHLVQAAQRLGNPGATAHTRVLEQHPAAVVQHRVVQRKPMFGQGGAQHPAT